MGPHSQWELEERSDCLVLTLRGGGSVTPLMVKGWTLEDLATVMRDATEGTAGAEPGGDPAPAPVVEDGRGTPGCGRAAEPAPATAGGERAGPRPGRTASAGRAAGPTFWTIAVTSCCPGPSPGPCSAVRWQSAAGCSWSSWPRGLRAGPAPGEEVVLGHVSGADPAAGQPEVVERIMSAHHLGGEAEPERRGRIDLGGVGLQGLARTSANPVTSTAVVRGSSAVSRQPLSSNGDSPELRELLVDLAEPLPGPDRVVELDRGERRPGLREAGRVTGGVEGPTEISCTRR